MPVFLQTEMLVIQQTEILMFLQTEMLEFLLSETLVFNFLLAETLPAPNISDANVKAVVLDGRNATI